MLPLLPQMDPSTATQIIDELKDIYASVRIVHSCPTVHTFSMMPGSISYGLSPYKIPATELFDVTPQLFTCTPRDKATAVAWLVEVLNNKRNTRRLINLLNQQELEKPQVVIVCKYLLRKVAKSITLNRNEYRTEQTEGLVRECMGMGTQKTWHGAPDARIDATIPVQLNIRRFVDSSDSDCSGKVMVGGKPNLDPH